MKHSQFVKAAALLLVLGLLGIGVIAAHAAYDNEPFEFLNYYTYGGAKNGTFSLTYLGIGGGKCDSNDRRFRVNVTQSYPGSDWKMYSGNSRYQKTPSGRTIYGHQLNTTSNAHICVGASEFSALLHPLSYWTTSGVQQNVYTWRR